MLFFNATVDGLFFVLRGWWASGCLTVVYKPIQRNISCG